jgi:predicted aspartyl protease
LLDPGCTRVRERAVNVLLESPMLARRSFLATAAAFAAAGAAKAQVPSSPIVAKFTLQDGRILIDTLIDGHGPYPFAVDTGAVVSGLQDELAKTLGLKKLRDVQLNGGKAFPLYAVGEMVLGGAIRQQDAAMFGLDMKLRGAVGLLAAGMVTAFDSEIDFERLEWRVHPAGQPERPGFTAIDSAIRQDEGANGSRRISLKAVLDGRPLKLLVDTGSPRAVTVNPEIAKRMGLSDEARPFAPVGMAGIDGPAPGPGRTVRAERLEVGPLVFEAPLVSMRPRGKAMEGFDGIIGLPALQRMNLSVDAVGGALWVQKNNRPYGAENYNRAGLWLDAEKGGARVAVVGTGSPAAAAGLKVGDGIVVEREFGALLRPLGGPAGSQVTLLVKEPKGERSVTLTLADYL